MDYKLQEDRILWPSGGRGVTEIYLREGMPEESENKFR